MSSPINRVAVKQPVAPIVAPHLGRGGATPVGQHGSQPIDGSTALKAAVGSGLVGNAASVRSAVSHVPNVTRYMTDPDQPIAGTTGQAA